MLRIQPPYIHYPPDKKEKFKKFSSRLNSFTIVSYYISYQLNKSILQNTRMVITRIKHCTILRIFKSYRKDTNKNNIKHVSSIDHLMYENVFTTITCTYLALSCKTFIYSFVLCSTIHNSII